MIGVNGVPWIDVSSKLDVERIKSLNYELCKGISQSRPDQGNIGPSVLGDYRETIDYAERHIFDFLERVPEKRDELLHLFRESRNQFRIFLKLYFGFESPITTVYLRRPKDFFFIADEQNCEWTDNAKYFPQFLNFIAQLPFSSIGRVVIFMLEPNNCSPIHSDFNRAYSDEKIKVQPFEKFHEFLWFNPQARKKFFVFDDFKSQKHYVSSPAAFFNTYDYHGCEPIPQFSYSVRVDGVFTREFREWLGLDATLPQLAP